METDMARPSDLGKMTFAELTEMEARIERLKAEKQNAERTAVRKQLMDLAKEHGFDIRELLDGRKKGKGSVAAKYRDPKNPENTWTGRGRMPRWMAAATKGGKVHKDDFLIK
jgi:DNA-binding protein H-NS